MSYQIQIEKPAQKFIHRLPKDDKERVLREIYRLPDEGDIRPIRGKKGKGFFRLRVGNYRIIYSVNHSELVVLVVDADNRGQIYKRYK